MMLLVFGMLPDTEGKENQKHWKIVQMRSTKCTENRGDGGGIMQEY